MGTVSSENWNMALDKSAPPGESDIVELAGQSSHWRKAKYPH